MDDGRFYLAKGLMTILPHKFDEYRLLLTFDHTGGEFVNWTVFLDEVNDVFQTCHASYNNGHHFYVYQSTSVLSICYPDQLLETEGVKAPFKPVVFPGPLSMEPILFEHNRWENIHKMPIDDFYKMEIAFFLPVYIWAYNELKRALLQDEIAISNAEFEVELQRFASLPSPDPAEVPLRKGFGDIREQFKTGTGHNARTMPFWRERIEHGKQVETVLRNQFEVGLHTRMATMATRTQYGGRGGAPGWQEGGGRGGHAITPGISYVGAVAVGQATGQTPGQAAGQTPGQGVAARRQQGNMLIDWQRTRQVNLRMPSLGEEAQRYLGEPERLETDAAEAVMLGILPSVPIPAPAPATQLTKETIDGKHF